jgi:serine/threonine protein kinase
MQNVTYAVASDLVPGVVLQGTYRLEQRLGVGGMGEVWQATHARLPGQYAVKVLLRELTSNREALARFCREAEIMAELRHPNIVQVFDFNTTPEGVPYFVMEYLDGVDLGRRLASERRLAPEAAADIVRQAAAGLAAAHRRGVVHRDLKPQNMFLMQVEGQTGELVKILDFGISKVRSATNRLSRGSQVFGTPQYMAPEQALGSSAEIDGRADQFALAAITFELLTGHDAFLGQDPASLLFQVVHEPHQPLARYLPGDVGPVQAVLDRALSKSRADRYPTILEFAHELVEAMAPLMTAAHPHRHQHEDGPGTPALERAAPEPPAARARAPRSARRKPPVLVVPDTGPLIVEAEPAPTVREEAPVVEDWDLPSSVDRIPVSPVRAVLLATVATCLVGLFIMRGWHRDLVSDVRFFRQNAGALLKRPVAIAPTAVVIETPSAPQPAAVAPTPQPALAAPYDVPLPPDFAGAGEATAAAEPAPAATLAP